MREIISEFKAAKTSIKFWNILAVVAYYSTCFFSVLFPIATAFVSMLGLILLVEDKYENQHWLRVTPLFLLLLVGIGIIEGFLYLYKRIVLPFNCWLDKCNAKPKAQTLDEAIDSVNKAYKKQENE